MGKRRKLADDYTSRIMNLQSKCSSLEERASSWSKTLDSSRHEFIEWKRKYEQVLSKQKAEEDQASAEIAILKSRNSAAEARLAAALDGTGASQMHKGIPHLHSTIPKMGICSAVGLGLESATALMSNLETVSVTRLTPSKEAGASSFLNPEAALKQSEQTLTFDLMNVQHIKSDHNIDNDAVA